MIYSKTLVLQPLVLISNRLHIVSSFPITAARKDLHKGFNKDLADRKENSCILLERKKINPYLTAGESCHLLWGMKGSFSASQWKQQPL